MATNKEQTRKAQEFYSTAVRTLLASGYVMSNVDRQPYYAEINCDRPSRLGAMIQYKIAVTADQTFDQSAIAAVRRNAANEHRALVLVSERGGSGQISWPEFLGFLGGALPSWRALSDGYSSALLTAAKRELPPGMCGEAWAIFEELTADGLEFCFGRKVGRFGGSRRGLRVSDMIAQLPDGGLVIVDSKAYRNGFNANWPSIRALCEYVKNQKAYQRGQNEIIAALIVSSAFRQSKGALQELSHDFQAEVQVPLCLMTATTLALIVAEVQKSADLRNAMRWKRLFVGGLLSDDAVLRQIKRVRMEKLEAGRD